MSECRFHNISKLINSKDINGKVPEVFISISNRGAGKTYGFANYLLSRFMDKELKFGLLCRWQRELGNTAEGIFKAVLRDNYPGVEMYETVRQKGVYSDIFVKIQNKDQIDTLHCGYVLPVNGSDNLKKVSSLFVDIDTLFMDEFQCDSYCPNEVDKFVNVHFTIARGTKEGVRYVPVILASNSSSIVNPYFVAMGLTNKIQKNTHFYRGDGFVMERFINKDVAKKQSETGFNHTFSKSKQMKSNIDNSWLNDSWACICKPKNDWGRGHYMCTFIDDDVKYSLLKYDNGLYYVSRRIDSTCKSLYSLSVDGIENVESIKRSVPLEILKREFIAGRVRFSDIIVKTRFLEFI